MSENAYEMLVTDGGRGNCNPATGNISGPCMKKPAKLAFTILSFALVVMLALLIGAFVMIEHVRSGAKGGSKSSDMTWINAKISELNISLRQDMNNTRLMSIFNGYLQQLRDEASLAHRKLENALNQTNDQLHKVMLGWYDASDNSSYKLFTEKVNYWTALSRCQNMGGTILMKGLRNATIFRELLSANVIHLHTAGCKTWIGLRYQQKDWVWVDNGTTNPLVVQWNDGQPEGSKREMCAVHIARVDGRSKARVNDAPCGYLCPYVCEVPTSPL